MRLKKHFKLDVEYQLYSNSLKFFNIKSINILSQNKDNNEIEDNEMLLLIKLIAKDLLLTSTSLSERDIESLNNFVHI